MNNYMQLLKNSGYSQKFRLEILHSGLQGYNKILKAERDGIRPVYRPKGWNESARWLEKRRKKNNWLGSFWKSCIFVPPTPGSELKKTDASKGGGDEARRTRRLPNQDNRDCWKNVGANIGEHRSIWRQPVQ